MTIGRVGDVDSHPQAGAGEHLGMDEAAHAPFAALLLPLWAVRVPANTLVVGGQVLMLPAMAAVVLRRRSDYAGTH